MAKNLDMDLRRVWGSVVFRAPAQPNRDTLFGLRRSVRFTLPTPVDDRSGEPLPPSRHDS